MSERVIANRTGSPYAIIEDQSEENISAILNSILYVLKWHETPTLTNLVYDERNDTVGSADRVIECMKALGWFQLAKFFFMQEPEVFGIDIESNNFGVDAELGSYQVRYLLDNQTTYPLPLLVELLRANVGSEEVQKMYDNHIDVDLFLSLKDGQDSL